MGRRQRAVLHSGWGSALTYSRIVSIVIPARNAEERIAPCLAALLPQVQARGGCEVIVVDDASTDLTSEKAWQPGVTVYRLPRRQGPAAARNLGAARARGDILLFLDADCEPADGWLLSMLQPFIDPGVCGVYGAYASRQPQLVARFAQAEFEERYGRLTTLQSIDFMATHAAAIRRDVFDRLGGFSAELLGNEDVDLAYRLSRQGRRVAFAPGAIVYHEHPATLWRYLRTKASRGFWRTIVYARHPHKALHDDYTPPWLKLQVAGVVGLSLASFGAAFAPPLWLLTLLLGVLLLVSTVPFTLSIAHRDRALAWIAPFLSLARSAALGAGVVAGLAALAIGLPRQSSVVEKVVSSRQRTP